MVTQLRSNETRPVEQGRLVLIPATKRVEVPEALVLKQPTFLAAVRFCIQSSGLDDKQVYMSLDMDPGHFSNIMKGKGHFPTDKLTDLMDLCGNEAPLIWLANQRGYALVLLKSEAERRAEQAERALAEEQEKTRMLTEILKGK